MRLTDLLPHAQEVGLLFGKHNDSVIIFQALKENLYFFTFDRCVLELVDGNRTLRLETEFEYDHGVSHAQNRGINDLTLTERLEASTELFQKRFKIFFGR